MMRPILALAAATLMAGAVCAQMPVFSPAELKHYNVTIRRFDPIQGVRSGQDFVLPVDSPDEEHAIASTLANAASFSKKAANGRTLPVAFMATRVAPR